MDHVEAGVISGSPREPSNHRYPYLSLYVEERQRQGPSRANTLPLTGILRAVHIIFVRVFARELST